MNFLDMRTVMFSHVVTDVVCAVVIVFLWSQNRKRFAGTGWWALDFALQTAAVMLIVLRGRIPDWISMALANTLVMAGSLCGYVGLERFVGKISSQVHNYVLLAAFAGVHTYFTLRQPNLAARNLNVSLGLLLLCGQCAWLMLRRVEPGMRPLTRAVGIVFAGYCLVSLIRMIEFLTGPHPENDFFKSGAFDTLTLLSYQMLLILLTYSLALLLNGRLLMEVRIQEEKFTKAFHSSPYAITLTRLTDGKIFEVNDGFVELSGYQAAEVIGKTTPELHLWANEDDRRRVVNALAQQQPVHEQECQFRRKSGEILICLISAEILMIDNQMCVLSSISDITARARIEEDLRTHHIELQIQNEELQAAQIQIKASRQRYVNLYDFAPVGYCTIDRNGQIVEANLTAARLFGVERERLIRTQLYQFLVTEDRDRLYLHLRQLGSTRTRQTCEVRLITPDGSRFYVQLDSIASEEIPDHPDCDSDPQSFVTCHCEALRSTPPSLPPLSGEGWGEVGIASSKTPRNDITDLGLLYQVAISDITARKRAEQERHNLTIELTRKNKELEQLVYVTSHDLRSPLVNIQGFSHELHAALPKIAAALQDEGVPGHVKAAIASLLEQDMSEALHYILTSATKMDALLAGLLKLSRLGQTAVTITELDMNTLIANVLNAFAFQFQEAGVQIAVSKLPFCQGDATKINQVFSNLVDNALKYLDATRPGIIKIWGDAKDAQSIYCVEDNGIGIASEHQQKIFEVFHRLNPNAGTGEGLGLAIVQKILERQGGKIWVESEPGKGSKFYVSLPGI